MLLAVKVEIAASEYCDCVAKEFHNQFIAFIVIEKAGHKYEELYFELENNWHKSIDKFPTTIDESYTLLETYKGSSKFICNTTKWSK